MRRGAKAVVARDLLEDPAVARLHDGGSDDDGTTGQAGLAIVEPRRCCIEAMSSLEMPSRDGGWIGLDTAFGVRDVRATIGDARARHRLVRSRAARQATAHAAAENQHSNRLGLTRSESLSSGHAHRRPCSRRETGASASSDTQPSYSGTEDSHSRPAPQRAARIVTQSAVSLHQSVQTANDDGA